MPSTSADKPSNYEKDLQLLKEFDLNWEFGPCIGKCRTDIFCSIVGKVKLLNFSSISVSKLLKA